MLSPFPLLQISLTSSAPRFASLLQLVEVQRLVETQGRCHLPHHLASLFVHRIGLLPSRDMRLRALPGAREAQELSTYPYRACDSAGPDTSGATRLLGGAVRPRSRLRSWGRVAVTSQGPALPVIGEYVPRQINRETGLTGEMPPSPSSWPLSVLDLSPLRHHPRLPSHMLARVRAVHSCWRGVVPLVPTVSLSSVSSPCLHPMATPLCLGGAL